jgi:DNA adenine methylase
MKTFIRWQGNKSKHINKFIQYIPHFTGTYIEPFLGSGALLLKLQPKKWIVNDINKDLINIWKYVKNNPQSIIDTFTEFCTYFKPLSKEDKVKYCKEITSKIESMPYDIKRASMYLLMKFCSFSGNIITKNKFLFEGLDQNIYIRNNYPFLNQKNYDNINQVSNFLNTKSGKIFNKSYEKILDKAKEGDFVFLDPPYIDLNKYRFNYNKDEILDDSFIQQLFFQVKKLDDINVKWLMTQADTQQIKDIFKDYTIKTFQVYRSSSKSYTDELLIMNYEM